MYGYIIAVTVFRAGLGFISDRDTERRGPGTTRPVTVRRGQLIRCEIIRVHGQCRHTDPRFILIIVDPVLDCTGTREKDAPDEASGRDAPVKDAGMNETIRYS
jgi:hypothetical protein